MIEFEDRIYNEIDRIYSKNKFSEIVSDLELMRTRFSVVPLEKILEISHEEAQNFLRQLIEDEASIPSYGLIDFLLQENKIDYLFGDKYSQFIDFYKKRNEERGELIFFSPTEIESDFSWSVREKLHGFFSTQPRIIYLVDSDLIAGCRIEYKGEIFDLSLKGRYPQLVRKYLT